MNIVRLEHLAWCFLELLIILHQFCDEDKFLLSSVCFHHSVYEGPTIFAGDLAPDFSVLIF